MSANSEDRGLDLVLVNRYFAPDQSATSRMASELAFGLAAQGHRVRVVCSRQLYEQARTELAALEQLDGVEIHRVWSTSFGRHPLPGRLLDYLTFYASAFLRLRKLCREGSPLLIVKTDPPLLSVLTTFDERLSRVRQLAWCQDLFPEMATARNARLSRWLKPLRQLRDLSLWRSRRVICVGEDMARHLKGYGVEADVIENWLGGGEIVPVAPAENSLRKDWGLDEDFVVGYSGNLGRAHDCDTVLKAMKELGETGPSWLLVGGGSGYRALQESEGLPARVQFRDYLPLEQLCEGLSVPDVHWLSLRPECASLVLPSKFYGIVAAGRPMLFIGPSGSELARVIEREQIGLCVEPGQTGELVAAIRRLREDRALREAMGQRARAYYEREASFEHRLRQWEQVLREEASYAPPAA